MKVVYLDAHRDGVGRISEALSQRRGLDAIHVISHGEPGKVFLGNSVLSTENLEKYNSQLRIIGQSLKKGGNILFYGCDVAQGEVGDQLTVAIESDSIVHYRASGNQLLSPRGSRTA